MDPFGEISSMSEPEFYNFVDSILVVEKGDCSQIANQVFGGFPPTLLNIEDIKAILLRAKELGLNEILSVQLMRIQCIYVNIVDKKSVETIDGSPNRFEADLTKAKGGEPLPACQRLALFICQCQNSDVFNVADDLADNGIPVGGPFLSKINEGTVKPNRAEIALLYNEFLKAFDSMLIKMNESNPRGKSSFTLETLPIRWKVDYSPKGELCNIIIAGTKHIKEAREKVGGPKLPSGWGLRMQCLYEVIDGCAHLEGSVIDHSGKLLLENPWATFYRTEQSSDEKLARQLCPKIPLEIKVKLENRNIVRAMNYTFELNVIDHCYSENWGIVRHLIETKKGDIPQKLGCKVLMVAYDAKHWKTCKNLFKAGLPVYKNDGDAFSTFFYMIETSNSNLLQKILSVVKLQPLNHELFKDVVKSIYTRYQKVEMNEQDREIEYQIFENLKDMWTFACYPEYKSYEDVPQDISTKCELDFCKAIVYEIDNGFKKFKDANFEQQLRNTIQKIEKKQKK